jgi:hypothetical protein
MSFSRSALSLLSCAALFACSAMEDPAASTSTPRSLARWVLVSPAAPTIAPGQTLALDVEMQDASGRDISGQPEAWSTSDSSIATVDNTGIVTAHALGSAKIYIASGSQSAYADVSVSNAPPVPHWVTVTPGTVQISVRSTVALFASVTDAGGHVVANIPVTWTSANPALATVDTSGDITGVAPGSVNIVAHVGTNQATTQVHVVTASTVTAPAAPAPPPPAPVIPPPSAGSLFGSYSATSPHWPHIRTMMTDFYYGWNSAERTWAGQHYDYAMSGSASAWTAVNATVDHLPYTLVWTVIVPNSKSGASLGTVYYSDMVAWYHAHTSYNIEDAFLHRAGAARDSAGRKVVAIWDSNRWMINPGDAGARAYQVDRFQRITATEGGAFVDEASSDMTGHTAGTIEYPAAASFEAPMTATFEAIKHGMGGKTLMLNTAEYTKPFDRANVLAAGAVHMERMNNAFFSGTSQTWQWIESLTSQGVLVDFVTIYSSQYVNTIPSTYPHGNSATGAQRMKLWELASYYMVVSSTPQNLVLQLENAWSSPYSSLWIRAQEANIGHPVGARVLASRGTDPMGNAYALYTRDMDKALVVMRVNQGWGSHSYTDGTAVTIPLPSTDQWVPLNADGTLGSPVTSVTLRNVEAAILLKKSRL